MEMQVNETKLDLVKGMLELKEKYGSIQGIITACEKMKVPRKQKKEKKIFLKFLRGIEYNINHKNTNMQSKKCSIIHN